MTTYTKHSLTDTDKYTVKFAEYKYLTHRNGRTYMMVCFTKKIKEQ